MLVRGCPGAGVAPSSASSSASPRASSSGSSSTSRSPRSGSSASGGGQPGQAGEANGGSGGGAVSIERAAEVSHEVLNLGGSCTITIDGGSLVLDHVDITIGSVGFVLLPQARLVISNSVLSGDSAGSTMTVTSGGDGQTVDFSRDSIWLGRGILVEVGMGSSSKRGVKGLDVSDTTIVSTSPGGLGVQFISRGPARFYDDTFRAPGNGSVAIRSATPQSCHVKGVRGVAACVADG